MRKSLAIYVTVALVSFLVTCLCMKPIRGAKDFLLHKFTFSPSSACGIYADDPSTQKIQRALSLKFPVTEKKAIVVVIASYNNEAVCEKNLRSLFEQTYDNYRLIYIDDCSKDKTYEKVKNFIESQGQSHRVTLIHNASRQLKLPNLYKAYHSCQDHEIIICLDGDDWLPHERVLEEINECYQNPEVWLTYGSAVIHPGYEIKTGKCLTDDLLLSNRVRDTRQFVISMLRTFYAGLFKQIKLKDLFYNGSFYQCADDIAFMIPMIEMAGRHVLFIKDVLYVINDINPIREHKVSNTLGTRLADHIFSKKKYQPFDVTFNPRNTTSLAINKPLELVITSNDTPLFLATSLPSYLANLSNVSNILIYYTASTPEFKKAYETLQNTFTNCLFIEDNKQNFDILKHQLEKRDRTASPYIFFASDDIALIQEIPTSECIRKIEHTGAKGFFLGHTSESLKGVNLDSNLSALRISDLVKTPELTTDSFLAILKREDLHKTLLLKERREKGLLRTLLLSVLDGNETCLFHESLKSISLTPKENLLTFNKMSLLHRFNQGERINLNSFKEKQEAGIKEEHFYNLNSIQPVSE